MILLQQVLDMSLVGMINLCLNENSKNSKAETLHHNPSDLFQILVRNLKSISEVSREMISKVSLESQKLHIHMLMNRNKGDSTSTSHFAFDNEEFEINDEFLEDLELIVN